MLNFSKLTVSRQNKEAELFAARVQSMSSTELDEYLAGPAHLETIASINNFVGSDLTEAHFSLLKTHYLPGRGAFANILDTGLALASGMPVEIISQKGDARVTTSGKRWEKKISIRDHTLTTDRPVNQHVFNLRTASQIEGDTAADHVSVTLVDIVSSAQAKMRFIDAPLAFFAAEAKNSKSAKKGQFVVNVLANHEDGITASRGISFKMKPFYHFSPGAHMNELFNLA